jgi:hypothetical protein
MIGNFDGADRLAMSVTRTDGTVTRWGPDEPDPINLPGDLSFGSQMPGGFKDLSCSLLRRIDLDYPDLALFDTVRVYAPGNRTVWEGRMAQFPRSHGDGFSITPGAVGWSAHLTDDPSFTEVYVDRDISHWQGPSLAERLAMLAASHDITSFTYNVDGTALMCALPNQALGAQVQTEAWYTAPAGVTVAKVSYKGTESIPAGYRGALVVSSTGDPIAGSATVAATLDDTVRTATLATPRRYVFVDLYSNGTAATPAPGAHRTWKVLAAYGSHGLTTRAIVGEPDGLYASDVIANIVSRAAPLLTVASGAIQATTFVIPHLVFTDPTTAESAIQLVNAYHGYDWGVYDNKQFFYRASDPALLTWQARLSTGARLDLEGDTAEQVFNGVYVTYQDATGQKKTVGPTGASADDTSASLARREHDEPRDRARHHPPLGDARNLADHDARRRDAARLDLALRALRAAAPRDAHPDRDGHAPDGGRGSRVAGPRGRLRVDRRPPGGRAAPDHRGALHARLPPDHVQPRQHAVHARRDHAAPRRRFGRRALGGGSMADDLTDAEAGLQAIQGIDNHPIGFAVLRAVRLLRAARAKFSGTDDRIAALEARVTRLEGKP